MANHKFQLLLTSMLLVFSAPVSAQTAYLRSTGPCLVTAYPAPAGKALPEKLACDEKVTILERQGGYVRIRTGNEKVVWVDDVSTTTELPASLRIQRLTEYQREIEKELEHLNKKVYQLSKQSEKLLEALLASRAEQGKSSKAK